MLSATGRCAMSAAKTNVQTSGQTFGFNKFYVKSSLKRRHWNFMLALPGGLCDDRLSRDMAALRDRHVRLKSVKQDMELDLPPSIRLPDGEELPYGCATRLHIRDPEQESEIYQKCVRPPPNRTVYDSESPPPYRSSSAGLLTHPCVDWSSDSSQVVRCHSMSSGSAAPTPSVVVPSRSRRLSAFTDAAPGPLSTLTMVPCHAPSESV